MKWQTHKPLDRCTDRTDQLTDNHPEWQMHSLMDRRCRQTEGSQAKEGQTGLLALTWKAHGRADALVIPDERAPHH